MTQPAPHTLETATALLSELVAIPSVNPGDGETFASPYGEQRLAEYLAAKLAALGGTVAIDEVRPGRPNVLAIFRGRNPERTILLDAHSDTVSHLNMAVDPFAASIVDGRLYGRGACDDKGPMTAALLALEGLVGEGRKPPCTIAFAATCDEENGATGAAHLLKKGLQVDFAVVVEPTELALVFTHKGVLRARIATRGLAAHSSMPSRGRNAIYAMARVVAACETLAGELERAVPHAELGTPKLSVVTIAGGTAANIIPDRCVIQIDRRMLPEEDPDAVKRELEARVRQSLPDDQADGLRVDWSQYYPPLAGKRDSPWITRLAEATRQATGQAKLATADYATNAGPYSRAGIPCVVFGPGSVADAHTANESIELGQILVAADVLHRFLSAGG